MTRLRLPRASALVLAGMLATACGGGSTSPTAASPAPAASPDGGRGPGFPGASGQIAAINGSTLEVQDTSGQTQTAVTYGPSTHITQTVHATAADARVGVCAAARPAVPSSGVPSAPPTAGAPVRAATVTLSPPAADGSCRGGAGFAGGRQRFAGATPPPGGGRRGGRGAGGFGANGKIVSIAPGGFTVERTARGGGSVTQVQVLTDSATRWSQTVAATPAALAVGLCVTAVGPADDTGTVAATALLLRPAVNGTCTAGRGPAGA